MIVLRLFWRFVLICTDLTNEYLGKNGPQLAAAVGYFTLFSLIPLSLALMSLLGFFLGSQSLTARLVLAISSLAPVSQESVADTLRVVSETRHIAGVLGLVGLLWASTAVFGTIRKGVNALWGIQKTRPFFHERFIDFCLTAGTGFLMVAPLALTAGVGFLGEIVATAYPNSSFRGDALVGQMLPYLSPLVSLLAFVLLYRYLPNTKVTFRDVWPGALMAAIAFEVTKGGFLWYARTFPIYNMVYGPVGALVALLTWVYVSANILLYGALATSRYSSYLSRKAEETGLHLLNGVKRMIAAESKEHG